jgi:hypothetical protein
VIGGPVINTGAPPAGAHAASTFEKFVLLDHFGRGTIFFSHSDLGYSTNPQAVGICPGQPLMVSAKDPQHTIRKTVQATLPTPPLVSPNSDYRADFTQYVGYTPPNVGDVVTALLLGDFNNDNRVTALDFGLFLSYYGTVYTQNDITAQIYPPAQYHLDASGNRRVGFEDYLYIQADINQAGDAVPGWYNSSPRGDATKCTVQELLDSGVREAKRYDLDGDGWVTYAEMQKVLSLKQAGKW